MKRGARSKGRKPKKEPRRPRVPREPNPVVAYMQKVLWRVAGRSLIVVGAVAIALVGYGLWMSEEVSQRFDEHRWSLPTRVYADGLVLYPGLRLTKPQLVGRLERLAYHRVRRTPTAPGEVRVQKDRVTVFLRAIELPVLTRKAAPVRITFTGATKRGRTNERIAGLKDLRTKKPLQILELEPEELMQVFRDHRQSRQLVSEAEVPSALVAAILAAEDGHFREHWGVDVPALFRAAYVNAKAGGVRQGGSTLTQQLAKSFFPHPQRNLWRKVRELVIAVVIELKYDKDTILELYMNEIYFGQRGSVSVHGVGEASRFYFGKNVTELTVAQCATLAGMIRSPNRYSPHKHAKRAQARRDQVLKAMHRRGFLDDASYAVAIEEPLKTVPYAPYVRTAPYFIDYVARQLHEVYPNVELSQAGLSVYTTVDIGVQNEAERALTEGLAAVEEKRLATKDVVETDQPLQGAIVVLQPHTGHVVAMAGGRDYGKSQFNRITQASRQPGSAFKPFVYLKALEQFGLNELLSNEPHSYETDEGPWEPSNYDGTSGGQVTMGEALAKSMNIPTVDLAQRISLAPIVKLVKEDFGFDLAVRQEAEDLSLALGAFEVVPLQLALGYAALAHDGIKPHALSIRSVVAEKGFVIRQEHLKIRSVTTPEKAFIMTAALRRVVDEGTARGLKGRGIDFPVAGKTGTTNDYRDAWFVGYTPELVALVWVGYDDNTPIGLPASKAALPIWADLMSHIRWRTSNHWFDPPPNVEPQAICNQTGRLALDGCPHKVMMYFEPGHAPEDDCPEHRSVLRQFLDIFD